MIRFIGMTFKRGIGEKLSVKGRAKNSNQLLRLCSVKC
jgi:hypothetical protein